MAAMVQELTNGKVDKEMDKGLSTHDFTTAMRDKLASLESGSTTRTPSSTRPAFSCRMQRTGLSRMQKKRHGQARPRAATAIQ